MTRYDRQTILDGVGIEGQEALTKSRVLCVGAGGLGSPVLLYLAAAGVGTLGIMDDDRVAESNLQRQVLFPESALGKSKVSAAKTEIQARHPKLLCLAYEYALTSENALELISQYDLVIDGTDQFAAKFLINDACTRLGIPWVYASVNQWEGQIASFFSKEGPCFRCFRPRAPVSYVGNCSESGVLGATVGIIGSWQALHALRILLPRLEPEWGALQIVNTRSAEQLKVQIQKNPACPTCSLNAEEIVIEDLENPICETNLKSALKLRSPELLRNYSSFQAIDVRTVEEWNQGHLPQALHWPLSELEKNHFPSAQLSKIERQGKRPVLYCQGGVRSARAASLLSGEGYDGIMELQDGLLSWSGPLE